MAPAINMIIDMIDVAIKHAIESFMISALFSSTVAFVLGVGKILINSLNKLHLKLKTIDILQNSSPTKPFECYCRCTRSNSISSIDQKTHELTINYGKQWVIARFKKRTNTSDKNEKFIPFWSKSKLKYIKHRTSDNRADEALITRDLKLYLPMKRSLNSIHTLFHYQ